MSKDSPAEHHRLEGLEPDNLLAFLALLGLLRALETARPAWRPKAAWDLDKPPLRPVLFLAAPQTQAAVAEAAAEGVEALTADFAFNGRSKADFTGDEAKSLLSDVITTSFADQDRRVADIWSSTICNVALKVGKKKDGEKADITMETPFSFLGGGQTGFLKALSAVSSKQAPNPTGTDEVKRKRTAKDSLAATLFSAWLRVDKLELLRWDSADDRRHAHRFKAPTDDKSIGTEHGANRLAICAFPLFTAVPVTMLGRVRLGSVGTRTKGGETTFVWPTWGDPLTLSAIRAV
jgi:hypothetical protein